jgi:hypothetical protein
LLEWKRRFKPPADGLPSGLPACRFGDETCQGIARAHEIPSSIPGGAGFLIEIGQNVPVAITTNELMTSTGNASKAVPVSIPEYCGLRVHI